MSMISVHKEGDGRYVLRINSRRVGDAVYATEDEACAEALHFAIVGLMTGEPLVEEEG